MRATELIDKMGDKGFDVINILSKDEWDKLMKDRESYEVFVESLNSNKPMKQVYNEREFKRMKQGDINWLDESETYCTTWKRIKIKNIGLNKRVQNITLNKKGVVYIGEPGGLIQVFGCTDIISGKPQILDDTKKTTLTLVTKASKTNSKGEKTTVFKFLDDAYNKRDDGYEEDTLEKAFWVYTVICDGEQYHVFCDKKIENQEVHTFTGMKMKVPHKKEFDKNLSCRGSANFFFCKDAESTIKPLLKEEIIPAVEKLLTEYNIDRDVYKKMMADYIFIHPDGKIYRHPDDYMRMRNAHLLSAKSDGSPLALMVYSTPGKGKTIEAECVDRIFDEGILEAGNSTPKVLIPSFKEKPANPGFILRMNRIALIDELLKMLDNQRSTGKTYDEVKSQLGQLNMAIDHKKRTVGSGNDNTLTAQATAKLLIFTNPDSRSDYLHQTLKIIDTSTFTRFMNWVKDEEHEDFIDTNIPLKLDNTYSIYNTKVSLENTNILYKGKVLSSKLRDFYLIMYDSCQRFRSNVNSDRLESIFQGSIAIATNPLKSLWKRRGRHHTKLILDGLVKYRCIFEDFDPKFEAIDKDYDDCERIMTRMVKSWDTYMGLAK